MKQEQDEDALTGQLAADSAIRDSMLAALMELLPRFAIHLQSKVAVAAPGARAQLSPQQAEHFDQRLREVMQMVRDAAVH